MNPLKLPSQLTHPHKTKYPCPKVSTPSEGSCYDAQIKYPLFLISLKRANKGTRHCWGGTLFTAESFCHKQIPCPGRHRHAVPEPLHRCAQAPPPPSSGPGEGRLNATPASTPVLVSPFGLYSVQIYLSECRVLRTSPPPFHHPPPCFAPTLT